MDESTTTITTADGQQRPLGTMDASVVTTAERFGVTEVATLDRPDFGVVRPQHTEGFALLP